MKDAFAKWARISFIMAVISILTWFTIGYLIDRYKMELRDSGDDISEDIGIL
jgi:hypothetical protein